MDRFSNQGRKKDSLPGPVIVFEPVTVRSGLLWRTIALAKLGLMIWGGVSLAGVGAGAVIYAKSALLPAAEPPALQAPPMASKLAVVQPQAQSAPQGASKPKPATSSARIIHVQPTTSVKPVRDKSATPKTIAAELAIPAPPPALLPINLADDVEPDAKPATQARLPQSRPSEPRFTGSIPRAEDRADSPRRFRRLRDVRLRAPYAPRTQLRMPPPLRNTDPVGRHIRQVWSSFPLPLPDREPWHNAPPRR